MKLGCAAATEARATIKELVNCISAYVVRNATLFDLVVDP